jgi:hypothetical protein
MATARGFALQRITMNRCRTSHRSRDSQKNYITFVPLLSGLGKESVASLTRTEVCSSPAYAGVDWNTAPPNTINSGQNIRVFPIDLREHLSVISFTRRGTTRGISTLPPLNISFWDNVPPAPTTHNPASPSAPASLAHPSAHIGLIMLRMHLPVLRVLRGQCLVPGDQHMLSVLLLGGLGAIDAWRDDDLHINADDLARGHRMGHIDLRRHALFVRTSAADYVSVSPVCHHSQPRPGGPPSGLVRKSSRATRHTPSSRRR